jgi:signal transduction histidine kinase
MSVQIDPERELSVMMGSLQRRGPWIVPSELSVSVMWGNAELDFREATLPPGLTTIHAAVKMGNLEVIVPPGIPVEMQVSPVLANVETHVRSAAPAAVPELPGTPYRDPARPEPSRLRIVGRVKLGNVEVRELAHGEHGGRSLARAHDHGHGVRHERREARRRERRDRWRVMHEERELWKREMHKSRWGPWWLQARMRRRIFSWLTLAVLVGFLAGWYVDARPPWYAILGGFLGISMVSGAIAFRLTRPLLMTISAARDIGDGKLDTRIDPTKHRGETRMLATAINDMATKIQQQLADQRQLLAAVSHELRTPLGHMRVLVETARDARPGEKQKELESIEREIAHLDDLVGKLLASSRLEFGHLERHPLDLGPLVTDAAIAAGVAVEAIEATGDVVAAIDPTLVRRAVANLLENARRHGGGAIAVRVERRGAQVAVEVDDAGPGVPTDRRADAFRAFVPSSGGGLGLGLALVSRIAVAHGGGAWIVDRPGGGARVGFTVGVAA